MPVCLAFFTLSPHAYMSLRDIPPRGAAAISVSGQKNDEIASAIFDELAMTV